MPTYSQYYRAGKEEVTVRGKNMSREEAKELIYELINSGILAEDVELQLVELAEHICSNDFEDCIGTDYCENCSHRKV